MIKLHRIYSFIRRFKYYYICCQSMEVLESPETVNPILEKWFLTSHCCLQSSDFRWTEPTNLVVLPFVKMLYVFLNNFLTSEVVLFSFWGKKNL